ncbi:unnamed protein product [Trichobilharzia regenti]|nr:unnamed protein product [Trichobilharzia regenti]
MKRFGGIAEYVLCYVDFMAHLNEDNNIRVLFERALGSNQISQERARLIWARFLQFESQVNKYSIYLLCTTVIYFRVYYYYYCSLAFRVSGTSGFSSTSLLYNHLHLAP